jgi:hypothetical protein
MPTARASSLRSLALTVATGFQQLAAIFLGATHDSRLSLHRHSRTRNLRMEDGAYSTRLLKQGLTFFCA